MDELYDGVFFRHLHCVRDEAFFDHLETFIGIVQGKKYKLNLGDLIMGRKTMNI